MTERQYDDRGNVRPADGRFRGEAVTDADELLKIREREIEQAELALAERRGREEAENQARLERAGGVNTTTPEYLEAEQERRNRLAEAARSAAERPVSEPADEPTMALSDMTAHPEADGAPVVDTTTDGGGDGYDAMSYPELQQAAKARDLNAGGSADDLKTRLRDADAAGSGE